MGTRRRVSVDEAELDVDVHGSGEPVVVISTALSAEELRPLSQQIARRGPYRVVHYFRRGYAGSSPARGPRSVPAEAADCSALLDALGMRSAHVVGASYSAAIALEVATTAPERVLTLTVAEPPPVFVPSAPRFRAANAELLRTVTRLGPAAALEGFMTTLAGPDWRERAERHAPGSVSAMERDAATFFDSDVPALTAWTFGGHKAARIRCPVLSVSGDRSGAWFAEVRAMLPTLLPQTESRVVPGADHQLPLTHAAAMADLVVDFLRRHGPS